MIHRWEERWAAIGLVLKAYQFARDAAVAEAWLIAQDPYLKSDEFGQSIDEVENLIKKHEAFEKAAAAQEERFAALERLTTFELKDMKRRQEEEQRAHADTIERQKAERYSRDQPDTRSDTSSIRETTDQSSREEAREQQRQGSGRSREGVQQQQRPRTVQVAEAARVEQQAPPSPVARAQTPKGEPGLRCLVPVEALCPFQAQTPFCFIYFFTSRAVERVRLYV